MRWSIELPTQVDLFNIQLEMQQHDRGLSQSTQLKLDGRAQGTGSTGY